MPSRSPLKLYACALCPAKTMHPFYTQRANQFVCGLCAGAMPGDPPQTRALYVNPNTGRVARWVRGQLCNVRVPLGGGAV